MNGVYILKKGSGDVGYEKGMKCKILLPNHKRELTIKKGKSTRNKAKIELNVEYNKQMDSISLIKISKKKKSQLNILKISKMRVEENSRRIV